MATLKIPAAYLEDARKASATEIALDGEYLRDAGPEDRPGSIKMLEREVRLHAALCATDGDVEVSAEQDNTSSPIEHMLDQVVRILAGRLDEAKGYGPVPMGDILEIADQLRWAATESLRMQPSRDDREPA